MGLIHSIIRLLGSLHRIIWLLGGSSRNISNRPLLDFFYAVLLGRVLFRYNTHSVWGYAIIHLFPVVFFLKLRHLPVLIVGNLSLVILAHGILSLASLFWFKVGFFLFQIMSRHTILMLDKPVLSRGRLPIIIVCNFCNNHFPSRTRTHWRSWRGHFLRYLRWRLVLIVWNWRNWWNILTDWILKESCYICSSGNGWWAHIDCACSQVSLCAIQSLSHSNQGHVRILLVQNTRLLRYL